MSEADKALIRKVIDAVKVTNKTENKELTTDVKELKRKVNANYNAQQLQNKDFEHAINDLKGIKKAVWGIGIAVLAFLLNALLELVKK